MASDEDSDDAEQPPKSFAQEMQELKDEVLQGLKEEEYPVTSFH